MQTNQDTKFIAGQEPVAKAAGSVFILLQVKHYSFGAVSSGDLVIGMS